MKKLSKIILCLSFAFIFSISSGFFSLGKASAALVSSASGTIPQIGIDGSYIVPSNNNWLFPSTAGSSTDLTLTITSNDMFSTDMGLEFMVYLQRPINNVWTTVAHAGFPTHGTKTVTFTREYNNSILYQTTPYQFVLHNPNRTPSYPGEITLNTILENVHYTAY